jgi:thymidylate synthase
MDAVKEILDRESLNINPSISLKEDKNFYDYTVDDFIISDIDGIEKLSQKLEIAI